MTLTRHTLILEVQTQSPLHITALHGGRYLPEQNKIQRWTGAAKDPGVPCALTRTLPIRKSGNAPVEEPEGRSRNDFANTPVIPANTLGGKLRSAAASLIEDALIIRGHTLSPGAYNTMRKGASSATLERDRQTVIMAAAGANHPFYGLFGGTSYGIDSNLVVHEGYPVTPDTLPLLRAAPRALEPASGALTSPIPIVKKDALLAMEDSERLSTVVGIDRVNAYHESVLQSGVDKRKRLAEDPSDKGKKTGVRTVAAVEGVNPGVGFQLAFDVTVRSPAQLGLLLLALQRLVDDGQIGGKRAKGFGRFRVLSSLISEGGQGQSVLFAPADTNNHHPFVGQDALQAAISAAETWIESVDVAELEAFASDDAPEYFKAQHKKAQAAA